MVVKVRAEPERARARQVLRRPPLIIRGTWSQLAGGAVAPGLVFVARIAAPLEVVGRGRPTGDSGLDMIPFISEPVAAVGALDPVEMDALVARHPR